jgi:hypothetical protein
MQWRVQLGINSTSDVWKFDQTGRRGRVQFGKFPNIMTYSRVLLIHNCTSNIA